MNWDFLTILLMAYGEGGDYKTRRKRGITEKKIKHHNKTPFARRDEMGVVVLGSNLFDGNEGHRQLWRGIGCSEHSKADC